MSSKRRKREERQHKDSVVRHPAPLASARRYGLPFILIAGAILVLVLLVDLVAGH